MFYTSVDSMTAARCAREAAKVFLHQAEIALSMGTAREVLVPKWPAHRIVDSVHSACRLAGKWGMAKKLALLLLLTGVTAVLQTCWQELVPRG